MKQDNTQLPDDNLSRYMREVRKYPMLDAETEAALARRWRDHRDPRAAERLVGSHQRLVVKMANQYRGYRLPLADLISEGNVGLMQAIHRFDVDRGYRLSTYAMWWIRAAINDYVLRSSSLVKIMTNESHKKLFFNLRRLRAEHQQMGEGDLAPEAVSAIAGQLGVSEADVVLMDRHLAGRDLSVNNMVSGETDSDAEWQDFLTDETEDQESRVMEADERSKRRALFEDALAHLDARERNILVQRRLNDDPPKLAELSEQYGVSRERIRQIEARAFEKVKKLMLGMAATGGLAGGGAGKTAIAA